VLIANEHILSIVAEDTTIQLVLAAAKRGKKHGATISLGGQDSHNIKFYHLYQMEIFLLISIFLIFCFPIFRSEYYRIKYHKLIENKNISLAEKIKKYKKFKHFIK
jgi:hypothetical protein